MRSSSKRLQRSPTAACSCSQLGSRRMCWPDFCATNSLVRTIPACLCQVHRLLAADRGWGGANAHHEAEGRRVPTEFLPNSWLFEVGVDQYHRALRARALSLTTHPRGIPGDLAAGEHEGTKTRKCVSQLVVARPCGLSSSTSCISDNSHISIEIKWL